MARPILTATLLAMGTLAAAPAPSLNSISVELPVSERGFPDAPGVDVISANCLMCHSAGMILNQPSLTRAGWDAEVKKMVGVYKAPLAAPDAEAIVAYLVRIKGL